MPKVSICLPAYNHPELVQRALESILIQEFDDYEIIITDDSEGSEVGEIVSRIDDQRIHYFKNTLNLGSPANWNRAASLAQGEYIKILHHDDWFPNKNCLSQFIKLLDEHPNSVLGFSSAYACRDNGAEAFVHAPSTLQLEALLDNPANLAFFNCIGAPSATIYRNKDSVLFDENLKWVVDIDFYIRILNTLDRGYSYSKAPLICVTFGGDHQITNACAGKPEVEVFEYALLFNKILQMPHKPQLFKGLLFFSFLLSRFEINSAADFRRVAKLQKISVLYRLALVLGLCIRGLRKIKQLAKDRP